ncbi:MAG TPA: hypothetical protein VL137_11050, partial [Polyangiaceae bacterium]|nr:hypothetical protein [Polyangiaceae bacterium]
WLRLEAGGLRDYERGMGFGGRKWRAAGVLSAFGVWGLVCGCGGGSSGSGPSEFVIYWADSKAWCGHTDKCKLDTLAHCESQWPTVDVTQRALNATGWTAAQTSKCEHSQKALDQCYVGTTCAQAADYLTQCADQVAAANSDCHALNDAVAAVTNGVNINAPSDFAIYYANSSAWCGHSAECMVSTLADCENGWPTTPIVQLALDKTGWSAAQISACEKASRADDRCYLALSCDQVKNNQGCEQENADFSNKCKAFLDALSSTDLTNPTLPTDPSNPGNLGIDVNVGAQFCNKVEMCQGSPLSATDRADCEHATNQAFGVLPNPAGAVQCLNAADCSTLMNDPQGVITGCVSIDAQATHCSGTNLHVCDTAGTCRDVDCNAACAFISLSSQGCAYDATYGYDKCMCS